MKDLERYEDKYGDIVEKCKASQYHGENICQTCSPNPCPDWILHQIQKKLEEDPYADIRISTIVEFLCNL